ncbi:ROK family protein [Nocardiopsis sp. CA-288880]|uniref:ROK family protein n=1 Tax=Nocardiopsis sp. CA-288880 TaxID=3239995 RepID=UPI003D99FD44
MGVAGVVDAGGLAILSSLYLHWEDLPLAGLLEELLPAGLAVTVHNDAALTAMAELHRGAGRGATTMLALHCEHVGIGAAIVSEPGSPIGLRHAFEAGHLALDPYGPRCPCGQRGCLELYCDGRALVASLAGDGGPGATTPEEVVRRARDGDRKAQRAVQDVANRLGTGLVSLVNILSPEVVVFSGLLSGYLELAGAELRSHLQDSIVARLQGTRFEAASTPLPVLLGAAEFVFEPLLRDPAHALENVLPGA